MADLTTRIPDNWSDEMIGGSLAQEVEAAVNINMRWYLASWDQGDDPKCCPKCAGVKYIPAASGTQWYVDTAPVLLEKGYASCESAAAMHTAHKRADGFRNLVKTRPLIAALSTLEGKKALALCKAAYTIRLEPSSGPGSYWHVVSIDEGVRHDATEEMDR
jgi:hypothetical protein